MTPLYKDLKTIFDTTLYRLSCITRWSNYRDPSGSYNEACKQGLNIMLTWFLAQEVVHAGKNVDFTLFPKISLHRAYKKAFKCDIHSPMYEKALSLVGLNIQSLDDALFNQLKASTSKDFFKFLEVPEDCLENKIFSAATKFATLVEINESEQFFKSSIHGNIREDLMYSLKKYDDIPGIDSMYRYLHLFEDISTVRHHIRWASYMHYFKFSDLAHMYETAWFEYLLSLSQSSDEKLATQHFFIGAFHDLPEAWTGDIPSPTKQLISGLREGTEKLELMLLEEHVYNNLSDYQVNALKSIMLEEESQKTLKKLGKTADYLDAAFECYRILKLGNETKKFHDIFLAEISSIEKYPAEFRKLLIDWYCSVGAPEYEKMKETGLFGKI